MTGKFVKRADAERERVDWGTSIWLSRPSITAARELVIVEVTLQPGAGHNFHKHPQQEEVLYVLEGTLEQWVDRKKELLNPGDSAFIPADVVHASFNASNQPSKFLAILAPCIGQAGYELADVSADVPWCTLRSVK